MIESLLLLAKLRDAESRAMPTDIAALVRASLARYDSQIQERHIQLDLAPDLPPALAYGPWLEEVFANLIENAIKYLGANNKAPRVAIRGMRIEGGMCRYEVEDNGIGIARQHQGELFKMFTRIHPAHIRGAGLGLSIVERIVTKLGGQVGVESEEGRGSTFWFTLPSA
jgi:signal transduction histidine kinase